MEGRPAVERPRDVSSVSPLGVSVGATHLVYSQSICEPDCLRLSPISEATLLSHEPA